MKVTVRMDGKKWVTIITVGKFTIGKFTCTKPTSRQVRRFKKQARINIDSVRCAPDETYALEA